MEKNIVNTVYHAAVVSGLSIGFAQLSKMLIKATTPKLAPTPYDIGMNIVYVSSALMVKDILVKQKIIPEDIIQN